METISAAEADRGFSRILRDVRQGQSFVVTLHGVPIAKIVPAERSDAVADVAKKALLAHLCAQPIIVLGQRWKRDELYD